MYNTPSANSPTIILTYPDHSTPQPPRRLRNALQRKGTETALIRENRPAHRAQRSRSGRDFLRTGKGLAGRYPEAVFPPRDPP